ncbi:MAG: hypothetical protein IH932_04600, partial [Thaumarchaeota archaeon]|nr:hypothetical protein [Nitrososphaerota archaeon]
MLTRNSIYTCSFVDSVILATSEETGASKASSFVATGVPGLDDLLEGHGFPTGHQVFMLGSPGSGKTTLAFQFLKHGCEIGENG